MSRRVLFVSHDAQLGGGPVLLLHTIRWLVRHGAVEPTIALLDHGPLDREFVALGRTVLFPLAVWFVPQTGEPFRRGNLRGELRRLRLRAWARYMLHLGTHDLVYLNTLACWPMLPMLRGRPPILTHVHELPYAIEAIGPDNARRVLQATDRFVACSAHVRDALVAEGAPAEDIDIVPEHTQVPPRAPTSEERLAARRALGVAEDAVLVGACGSANWRKGADLFVQLALQLRQMAPTVRWALVWIGQRDRDLTPAVDLDIRTASLEATVRFIGEHPEARRLSAAFDVFVLPSREDPYPVVMLEAAGHGVPIVCFEGSGGAVDFVGRECGAVVPWLRVDAMARAVVELLDAGRRRAAGAAAYQRAIEHDVDVVVPRILESMERVIRP